MKWSKQDIEKLIKLRQEGATWGKLSLTFTGMSANALRKTYYRNMKQHNLKVLIFDIETSPLIVYSWGIHDQNIALNQVVKDWHVLSWAAKWLGDPPNKVMCMDQSKANNIEDDYNIVVGLWKLLDEADVILGHNAKAFDVKRMNSRFAMYNLPSPSSYRIIDTLTIARKYFSFSSNKLENLTKTLCKTYKKSSHAKFSGFELWKECLKGNAKAWKEMRHYNILDILSLEELYIDHLSKWDKSINFSVANKSTDLVCNCGSRSFKKYGFVYTNNGQYQRYICNGCGKEHKDSKNLLPKEKRKSLKR